MNSTATTADVQADMERTPPRCGKRQRADTEVIEINDSDSDTDSIIADVEKKPCRTCAAEEAADFFNVSYNECCVSCGEYLCSSNDNDPCMYLKRKECSVNACKQPVCTDCVAEDGRCVDCAECACCGQSDDTPKITCVDCGTQYCRDTCECECDE